MFDGHHRMPGVAELLADADQFDLWNGRVVEGVGGALAGQHLEGFLRHFAVLGLGLAAIIVAIVGRAWCSLYIGGRKNAQVMQDGPYSICRHPLYFFSTIGATGFGLLLDSLLLAALFAYYACRLVWQSHEFNDMSPSNDATPLWIPQAVMWLGTAAMCFAMVRTLAAHVTRMRALAKPADGATEGLR